MELVIVESPTKAKTISRFLGPDFLVRSSFGHVRDLPKSSLGIDVENGFKPKYVVTVKGKKVVAELEEAAKRADSIILATDPDREGEAIAWHLVQALGLNGAERKGKKASTKKPVKRVVFHEITKTAVSEAFKNAGVIDINLVDAQQARRVLDRLVGYELSPFLWKKIRFGLSAGRVQSVAVRLVVEREREIQNFKSQEYWSVEADFSKKDGEEKKFHAKLIKIGNKSLGRLEITDELEAKKIIEELGGSQYSVGAVVKKEISRSPAPPFTTSTLQQEASRKFGMSAKQTMMIAQQLYEGVNIGNGGETGLITYMRTDSVNMAQTALSQTREMINQYFGEEYSLPQPRYYANKSKNAQEAHEAIRPTDILRHPESMKQFLDRNQFKLYDLVWKRTVASQMQPALFDQTAVDIESSKNYVFRANGQVMKFDGFIRAYTEGKDEINGEEEIEGQLPELSRKDILKLLGLEPIQHFTEPPPRFSDATLIKALEAHGIGRPSTYAPILSTIQDRDYVAKIDKKYQPTEIGFLVNDMLVKNFPEIVDINFTSHIEEELDDIAEGKTKWVPIVEEFYTPFKKHLIEKEASVEKLVEESTTPCPHCGKMMIIKFGRSGKFLACPEPGSKVTRPLPEEAAKIKELEEKTKGEKCPLCGKAMIVKRGRFGYFLSCSDYPKCRGISKIWNKSGFKCPNCKIGEIVEKKSRGRGKIFYACTRFPECNFVINKKPESEIELEDALKKWQDNLFQKAEKKK